MPNISSGSITIPRVSFQQHQEIAMAVKKFGKNGLIKKNTELKDCITRLKGRIKNSEAQLHNVKESMATNIKEKSTIDCFIKSLTAVSSRSNSEMTLRLKGDHFKKGQASNIFKQMLYGQRYQQERYAAAAKVGLTGEVSINTATVKLNKDMHQVTTNISSLQEQQKILTDDISNAKNELSIKDHEKGQIDLRLRDIKDKEKKAVSHADMVQQTIQNNDDGFANLFQTNAGCKLIQQWARYLSGYSKQEPQGRSIENKVINEYEKSVDENIFTKKNGQCLKRIIKDNCDKVGSLTRHGIDRFYCDKNTTSSTYYRGQGMGSAGIQALITAHQQQTDNTYRLGQFFSTSEREAVAERFMNKTTEAKKVFITFEGFSGTPLIPTTGMVFGGIEREVIFSPRACVKITALQYDKVNDRYNITLQETAENKRAPFFPH